jgi:quercetin dioxygenase-like cupin family protein
VPHLGYCISGEMVVRMDSGDEFRIHEGDAFEIPSGHDAWVEGDRPCIVLDFVGYKSYALPKAA